ncbi:glycosyltransferase family 2 protein [Candidatus Microgenomates bacterium]|nr:glycosyltransferase family 2 protein [Candidatus Microgenomates bacterium]
MNKKPDISVIVPAFNSAKTIRRCMRAVLASKQSNLELIVVDDRSSDKTTTILKSFSKDPRVKLIFHKQNRGTPTTCNDGARIARGNYIVILGSDVLVEKNCISKLVEPMEQDLSIGMTQGTLISAFSHDTESIGHFLTIFGFPYELYSQRYKSLKKPMRIFGARAVTACRTELYKKIGGYDEDYIFHGEDTDFSWRVSLAGYQIYTIPLAHAYHYHFKSEKLAIAHYLYYEGPKNQISNIIKNTSLPILVPMLFLNLIIWLGLSIKCLVTKRPAYARGIYGGIYWNIRNIHITLQKRSKIRSYRSGNNDTEKIMFGPIGLRQYIRKGLAWLRYV